MMPVKDILEMRPRVPGPPVIVIDEKSIEETRDTGPVCGCHEKYQTIQNYRPFIPGGVNPYKRRNIPESECFAVAWKNIKIGSQDLILEKPFAKHFSELPADYDSSKTNQMDDLMYTTPPRYTEDYYLEKIMECPREHFEYCDCFEQAKSDDVKES